MATKMRIPKLRARAPLYAICFGLFANAYAMTNPFSYVAFLVESYGITNDRRAVGFFAGWIMSAFMAGRAVSSLYLGALSDRRGRKPVIQVGLLSCAVFQLLFGRAPSFEWAVAARLAMGLFNGIIAVAKAAIPEVVPASEQTVAMSWLAGVWGIAMVAGPAAGGLMVDTEAGQYLAPNALGSVLAVASIIAVHVYVPKVKARAKSAAEAPDRALRTADEAAAKSDDAPPAEPGRAARCARAWLPVRRAWAPLAYYCGLSFATIYYDECLPLWAVAPRSAGGLAQSAEFVGALLSVSGVSLAAFQFVGLPMLSRRGYSSTRILHICTGVAAVVYASTPLLSLVADNEAALATLLALHLSIQKAVVSACYTTIFVVTNNSVVASERGRLNGLAMAVASAFKAAGPVTGAVGFAWSLTNGIDVVPLDSSFAFLTSGLLMLICDACAVRWIGADYNSPPDEPAAAPEAGAEKAVDRV